MLKHLFLAIFLFASSDWALSQEPPKAPQVEPQQQPNSGLKAQENSSQKTAPASHPLADIPEISAEGADRKGQSKAKEGSEQGTEFWPPLYGYRLKVTDTLLVGITFLLFIATFALWLATRKLVRGAEETATRQLRAYVLVASAKLDLPKPDTPEAHMSFKNFGQTPAYNLRIWINMWIEEYPLRVVLPSPPANFQMATSILPPGGHSDMVIPNNAPVPSQSVHLLGTPEGTIYVYGEVRYIDAFEIERWTKYRLIYGGREGTRGRRMSPDTDGNEAT